MLIGMSAGGDNAAAVSHFVSVIAGMSFIIE